MSSITLGYLKTRMGFNKAKDIKRIRVLFDTGCDATLVNQSFVKKQKLRRTRPLNGPPKEAVSLLLTR